MAPLEQFGSLAFGTRLELLSNEVLPPGGMVYRSRNIHFEQRYFGIERSYERVLTDPHGEIIRKGEFMLFTRLPGEIVGSVAWLCTLHPHPMQSIYSFQIRRYTNVVL